MSSPRAALVSLAVLILCSCRRTANAPSSKGGPAGVPLETDVGVYELLQKGACAKAEGILLAFPEAARDEQWFLRMSDAKICRYRQGSGDGRLRDEIMGVFDLGLAKFPRSSRLMLERGIGALNWNDFKTAKEWAQRAKESAAETIRSGQRPEGMDDAESVLKQAESLLQTLKGS